MLLGDYIISHHAVDQYVDRARVPRSEARKRINKDLYYKKIKKIVHNGDVKHVFTIHSKEFIFVVDSVTKKWVLKTFIKRNRDYNSYVMNIKREKQKSVIA